MPKKQQRSNQTCSEEDRRLFLEAMGETVAQQKKREEPKEAKSEFLEALESGIDRNPDFKLKKQESGQPRVAAAQARNPIEAKLDLHASTLEMALRRTEEFLLRCHIRRFRRVLVIHGKGAGILRDGVRRYLEQHPNVAQVIPAKKNEGGDGAVIVILRTVR